MDGNITHQRSVVLGWDITASAKAGAAESISTVEIFVNGVNQYNKTLDDSTKQWQKTLTQQGQFPGDNTSQLKITDASGNETTYDDEWS